MAVQTPPSVLEAFGDLHERQTVTPWYQHELSRDELARVVREINAEKRAARR